MSAIVFGIISYDENSAFGSMFDYENPPFVAYSNDMELCRILKAYLDKSYNPSSNRKEIRLNPAKRIDGRIELIPPKDTIEVWLSTTKNRLYDHVREIEDGKALIVYP